MLRFSDQFMPRWDKAFAFNNLMHYTKVANTVVDFDFNIKKVWVCGPPLMSEKFSRYLSDLAPYFDLDFKTQIDIL